MKELKDKIDRLMLENQELKKEIEGLIVIVNKLEFQLRDKSNGLMYEDELADEMTVKDYNLWYKTSKVIDGVRMGNIFPKPIISNGEGGAKEKYNEMFQKYSNDPDIYYEEITRTEAIKYAESYHTSQMKKKVEDWRYKEYQITQAWLQDVRNLSSTLPSAASQTRIDNLEARIEELYPTN